jgi:hypothetical protein
MAMAWVSEAAPSATVEIRLERILVLASLVLASLVLATPVLDTAEAVSMEEVARYRSLEPFQEAQSRAPWLFQVRHTAAMLAAASVCLARTAADMLAHMVARTARPTTTTSVYQTWVGTP